ncbi:MAG: ZIP family metal transporter [Saprospiraceae bacterium]|nr:ZIP family metal transporter [Saprospiraceae bacterium]
MTLLIIVVLAILALGLILAYLPTFDYKYKKEIFVVCGAFIMGINFIKILPFGILKIGEQAGLYLLLGFFIQLLFEKMSEGVEHGHIHHHHSAPPTFGFQIILGLSLHSILEALPLAQLLQEEPEVFHKYLLGILVHHLPATLALVSILRLSGFSMKLVWAGILFFSLSTPLGFWIGKSFSINYVGELLCIASGSLMHISTTVIFETEGKKNHHFEWKKIFLIGIGIALAFVI